MTDASEKIALMVGVASRIYPHVSSAQSAVAVSAELLAEVERRWPPPRCNGALDEELVGKLVDERLEADRRAREEERELRAGMPRHVIELDDDAVEIRVPCPLRGENDGAMLTPPRCLLTHHAFVLPLQAHAGELTLHGEVFELRRR